MTEPESIDSFCRRVRVERGLSQAKAAALAGVAPLTWRTWELDRAVPSPLRLEALIAAFEVDEEGSRVLRGLAGAEPAPDGLARFVRARREELGLSQVAASARAGVTQQSWSGVERGVFRPSRDLLRRMARVLACPVRTLDAASAAGEGAGQC